MKRWRLTKAQLVEDMDFLLDRANKAGGTYCGPDERDVGVSSNELVRYAYTGVHRGKRYFPHDRSDLAACVRALSNLPDHRRTKAVQHKYEEYDRFVKVVEKIVNQ